MSDAGTIPIMDSMIHHDEDYPTTVHRRLIQSAEEIYNTLEFKTNGLYNEPAPEPWVSFLIGCIFSLLAWGLWWKRVNKMQKFIGKDRLTFNLRVQSWISAYDDNDEPLYTIAKMSAQSFLFLGGLQLYYRYWFAIMLCTFTLESFLSSLQTLLCYWETDDINNIVAVSREVRAELRKHPLTVLEPTNVYEDLTRGLLIVTMVFITQAILISFVVITVLDTKTIGCFDGTEGCPVTGTFGSWMLYVLGIFMACVYLLGPNTNFGKSEQNPAYWIQLLIQAKHSQNKCTWYDPVKDSTQSALLARGDWKIWFRFLMSFLINGVGFHVLVHALPIQVAGQSSLFVVVFRAVGMMYLVDLDDTPGYKITLVPKDQSIHDDTGKQDSTANMEATFTNDVESSSLVEGVDQFPTIAGMDAGEYAVLAQRIIDEAQEKLNALSAGRPVASLNTNQVAAFHAAQPIEERA